MKVVEEREGKVVINRIALDLFIHDILKHVETESDVEFFMQIPEAIQYALEDKLEEVSDD